MCSCSTDMLFAVLNCRRGCVQSQLALGIVFQRRSGLVVHCLMMLPSVVLVVQVVVHDDVCLVHAVPCYCSANAS